MVFPADEDFFLEWPFVEKWMGYAVEKGFLWSANCRYNYFTDKLLHEERLHSLVVHHLFAIGMSIEAGSERIRNEVLRKKVRDEQIYQAVDRIRSSVGDRLCVNTSFLAYFPGDDPENRIRTIQWMDYLSRNLNIVFSGPQIYRPYPGSQLYQRESGRKQGDVGYYLNEIDATGTEHRVKKRVEALFFSTMLMAYFNRRFRFLELEEGPGPARWKCVSRDVGSWYLSPLFFSVRIRLRLNHWRFFFEPTLLGFLFSMALWLGRGRTWVRRQLTKTRLKR